VAAALLSHTARHAPFQVGSAIADVLFGDVNPSARLPITMPNGENDQQFSPSQYVQAPVPVTSSSFSGFCLTLRCRWPGVPLGNPDSTSTYRRALLPCFCNTS
jgi:hypothetical protein